MSTSAQTSNTLVGATGAWAWDFATGQVQGDARFAALMGLDVAEAAAGLAAERFFQRVLHEDRMRLRIAIAAVGHGAELFARDFRVAAPDGVRWLSARGRAEHGPDTPIRFTGVLIDISEQKRTEERLRVAQSGAGGVGTFEYVEGFGTASVSDQFCRLLGLHPADALPVRTINGLVHPQDPPLISAYTSEVDAPIEAELRIRRADTGAERWLALRGERRPSGDGVGVSFVGAIYDITAAKAAEAKLREMAATLEQRVETRTQERDRLWNNSRDLFAVLGPNGVYQAVNPAWSALLGLSEDEVVGRHFSEFVHPDDLTGAEDHWTERAVLADRDARMRSKEHGWRWFNWTVIPAGDDFYATGRDVNERKQLEEQLRQSQKMEAVGQLTGGLAHDFNNMLTGVLGGLDMVRRRIAQGRVADAERFIDAAVSSAERAAALTHRLLAFSRRQTLDPQAVNVNQLISSMADMLRRTLGERIDLAVVLQPDLWTALIDANQLESALLNLAINARDAMPDGGKLTLETSNIHLDRPLAAGSDQLPPGDYLVVGVSDTGTGMPEHVIARAFDPFFTTKPLGQGTGLGLSMVYGFAHQSGGHVSIYSAPGLGTTVKLYLPRHLADTPAVQATSRGEAPGGAGETVLVVEDEPAVRAVIVELLNELGYETLEVADTDSALKILHSSRQIDLLISDVGLPGLNGRQLADVARQSRADLPVLFITGYAAGAARRSEFLAPGMEMISKPFAVDALALKIREMLGS